MRRFFNVFILSTLAITLFSCSSSRKTSDKNRFVPFTRELKQRLERDNIDLRQVQFYIDQKVVMSRYVDNEKVQVTSGVVKFDNGQYVNEVVVPSFTPGVCEQVINDRLLISFEKGNNDLAFGLGTGYSSDNYVLYGNDWKNGTAVVSFDNNKFRARCATCQDLSMVRLLVRKS
ncbi:MAG: hypothetical protein JST96_16060 [Bacteroidetes bacterium]|nr:hypothetical protein [Bacteroidota bacterium]